MIPGVLAQLSIVAEVIPPEAEAVVFLSGFEGVDASTGPMVDESTFEHVMTFNGNVELDTAQQKFGASSLESVISIGTDDYISVPNHACFHFADGDFTIEGFARSASLTGPHNFVSLGTSPNFSFRALLTESFSNDVLQFSHSVDGTTIVNSTSSTISLSVNTWYHWAFVRNNLGPGDDTLYFFIDGVQFGAGSLNQDALFPSTDNFIINGRGDGFEGHRGHLDEVRVLNYAAYTANFTPPAAPFDRPASGVLAGTTSLMFTLAGDLDIGLTGTAALTFTATASLSAAADLSATSSLTFTPAADLDVDLVLDGTSPTAAYSVSRAMLSSYGGSFYTDTAGAITALLDQSGASRDATDGSTSTRRPALSTAGPNSVACADFDGSSDYLSGATIADFITNGDGWMVVSCIFDTISNTLDANFSTTGHALIGDSGGVVGLFGNTDTGTDKVFAANYVGGASDTRVGIAVTEGTAVVLTWRHEGGNLYVSVNGGSESSIASAGSATGVWGSLRIGYRGNAFFDGKLFEAATYKVIPDGSTRAAIIADMMAHIGAT